MSFPKLLSLVLLFAAGLAAQISGDLRGVVLDTSGGAVPQAKVTLVSRETGETRTQAADPAGRFVFNQLKIGLYEVRAEHPGFRQSVTQATIRSAEIADVTFRLEVGQVTETVTVTDAVTPLDSTNAQIQLSVQAQQIQEIPVARQPINFALTSSSVIPVTANNPFLGVGSYNANGGRGRGNNITVDGITATDISTTGIGGTQTGPLNFAQIKEVKLITHNFTAEYGRNSGSQLQFTTKAGTNEFHGEAYDFLRNNVLNARSFFDRSGKASVTRRNQFGYVIGGPVLFPKLYNGRNKTHFFQAYEGTQLRGAGAPRIAQVPTAAMRAQVTDPTSKKLLDQYQLPAATTEGATFGQVQQSAPNATKAFQFSFRLDHQITDKDTFSARYGHYQSEAASTGNTFINTNLANFGATSVNGPRNFNLAYTRLFSPTLVNEFRFGYGRSSPMFSIDSTVPLGPRVEFSNAQVDRFGVWEGLPQGRIQNTFQYYDTVAWTRGAHNFKFGADVYRYQANSVFDVFTRGGFTFANWDDFAAGRPTTFQQRYGGTVRGHRLTNHHYFAQDDWRVTRNLTLNIGVRNEVAHGVTEVNKLSSNLDFNCRDSLGVAGSGPLGCFTIGKPSNDTFVNWAPRFGFAWNPRGDLKTVVRGGYGLAYDFNFLNPITNQRSLPPFVITASLSGTASFTGANSYANLVAGNGQVQREAIASVGKIDSTRRNFGNVSPVIDMKLHNPQVQQWNLGVQRETRGGIVLKATYIGNKSNYLQRSVPVNLINDARARPAASLADETARLADFRAVQAASTGGATAGSNRMDPRFNVVGLYTSSANANYHGFEFQVQRAFRQGYFFQVGYTVSKSIDDVSDGLSDLPGDAANQQDPRNNRDNRAVSQFDIPQRMVITHSWEPAWARGISNGVLRRVLDGWGFSGITSFRAGFPVTFDGGGRRGVTIPTLLSAAAIRPNSAGPFTFSPVPAGSAGAYSTLNTDVQPISVYAASLGLSQPLIGNFGSIGRNRHRLNGERNFDWNVYKTTTIGENFRIQFRCEMYNVFNNTSFQDVNRNISNASFGQYTTVAQGERLIQLGLRLVF